MKKLLYISVVLVFLSIIASAQKLLPVIKSGTVINLVVTDYNKVIPIIVTIKNAGDTLTLAWKVAGTTLKGAAPDITRYFTQPHKKGVDLQRLQNDETFISVSRTMYQRFLNSHQKTLIYQGITYSNAMNNTKNFLLNGRYIDATYLESKEKRFQLWMLNYAPFPLILQADNPLSGINYKVISIIN